MYSLFNLSTRWRWEINATPWLLYLWEKDVVPTVQEAGWAPEMAWRGVEKLALTGFNP